MVALLLIGVFIVQLCMLCMIIDIRVDLNALTNRTRGVETPLGEMVKED